MRKESEKVNFRVVIHPRRLGDLGLISVSSSFLYGNNEGERKRMERDIQDRCEEIVKDVKRHVNQVGAIDLEFDQKYVCEHCGAEWTEGENPFNGGCCDKDCEEEVARLI
jgi:hypothetical protein